MRTNETASTFATATATPLSGKKQESTGISFGDILDTVNPLQHIPVVSSIYRSVTGDEISKSARVIGGGLYGGIVGAASAVVNVISENITGEDIGENVISTVTPDNTQPYQAAKGTALEATSSSDIALPELSSSTQAKPMLIIPEKKDTTLFFELGKEQKVQEITNLGLDNEGIRRQLLGELDEKLYKKL